MADEDLPPDGEDTGAIDAPAEDAPPVEGGGDNHEDHAPQPSTVEDLASEMGWRPHDQWKGDPAAWKPADEFMRNTVSVNRNLSTKLRNVEEQLSNIARTNAAMTERALAEQRQKLLAERQQAFEDGDADKFNAVDKQLTELKPVAQPNIPPPEVQDFMARNEWFNRDQDATNWAVNKTAELAKQGISVAGQLQIVEREARNLFPELFPAPDVKPKAAPLNTPGNRGGGKPAAKTFAALPAEAKAAALEYEKKGISRDEYARIYFEDQEA